MAFSFTLEDVAHLASTAGRDAVAGAAELALTDAAALSELTRLTRTLGDRAAAVWETARLQRAAAGKLAAGPAWLLTDEALQQAPPVAVAHHRARRLTAAGVRVHDVTCSVGTELLGLAAALPLAVGSDLDPVRLAMARANLAAAGLPERLLRADARTATTRGLLRYADPARRTAAGRRLPAALTVPTVAELDAASPEPAVLRVPPGLDYEALARPGEVEIVSLDGGTREAVLWPPGLAGVARRATVLTTSRASADGAGGGDPVTLEQVTSEDPDDVPVTGVQEYLVDPDGAVVRAHLVRHWAARHGLAQLDARLAYLTGPVPPPGVRAFRVLDEAPWRERTVADWCRRDGIGTLEIKQRGTQVVPDELRRRLRPALTGPTTASATLVLARVGQQARAYWCRAVDPVPGR